MSRPLTTAEAATQGLVIYRTGWPRRRGLVSMCAMVASLGALVLIVWLARTPRIDQFDPQSRLVASLFWGLIVALVILTDDTVEITATAMRRRSHLSELLGRGFRTVDLEPGSWYVRSRYSKGNELWVGSRPHSSPKQELLTFNTRFEDDPKALKAALRQAGVGIQDEHADWVGRRPILARLEMALVSVWFLSIPVANLGLLPDPTATALMVSAIAAVVVVHLRSR